MDSRRAELLEWAREALTPSFDAVAAGEGDMLVEVCEEAPGNPVESTGLLPCFAFESGLLELPGRAVGDSFVVQDDRWGVRVIAEPGRIRVWETGSHAVLRTMVLRVIRELALVQALGPGGHTQLHASALEWRGGCVAFAGPKLAGKTTTAARIASRVDASIIANDRVLLASAGRGCAVTGIPTLGSVRPSMWELVPDQFRTVPDVERPSSLTLAEYALAGRRHGMVDTPRQLYLTLPQLALEVGSSLSAGAPLACLALISLAPEVEDFELAPISRDEATDGVRRFSFGLPADPSERTIFDWAVNGDRALPAPAPLPDLDGVRAFRLAIGERFVSSATAPERLMRALFGE